MAREGRTASKVMRRRRTGFTAEQFKLSASNHSATAMVTDVFVYRVVNTKSDNNRTVTARQLNQLSLPPGKALNPCCLPSVMHGAPLNNRVLHCYAPIGNRFKSEPCDQPCLGNVSISYQIHGERTTFIRIYDESRKKICLIDLYSSTGIQHLVRREHSAQLWCCRAISVALPRALPRD